MKILTVIGARPQFIKAAAVSHVIGEAFRGRVEEVLIHTGQHYDDNMSAVFFEELAIPEPRHNLGVNGGSHGAMTGQMLERIERLVIEERPDWLLIYGDTNSTLAGALAAAKLHVPVAHVEAGLRSFNMRMPEEINRILADRVSSLLFCPTDTAAANLRREGVERGVHQVGDVMFDVALKMRERSASRSNALERLGLQTRGFILATCHRAENTDDRERLAAILSGLAAVARDIPVVLPLHPRTRKLIDRHGLEPLAAGITFLEPLAFLDMVRLESEAAVIATDSGGVQKEAFFYRVPCVTLRDETEWVETVASGWNRLAPPAQADIADAILSARDSRPDEPPAFYGDGAAAGRILDIMLSEAAQRAAS